MWDARRRNRNLGTERAGHGARNRFAIPERDADLSRYWERLRDFVAVERALGSHRLAFLVEPTRPDCLHHCTRLRPVWGRLGYWSQIGGRAGPGVYLDAQPVGRVLEWGKHLRPQDEVELERFRACGFDVESHARGWHIRASSAAIRESQLYRTLPHELGHWAVAHRYADAFRRDARARGLIPFPSTFDAAALRADRLDPAWFAR